MKWRDSRPISQRNCVKGLWAWLTGYLLSPLWNIPSLCLSDFWKHFTGSLHLEDWALNKSCCVVKVYATQQRQKKATWQIGRWIQRPVYRMWGDSKQGKLKGCGGQTSPVQSLLHLRHPQHWKNIMQRPSSHWIPVIHCPILNCQAVKLHQVCQNSF